MHRDNELLHKEKEEKTSDVLKLQTENREMIISYETYSSNLKAK